MLRTAAMQGALRPLAAPRPLVAGPSGQQLRVQCSVKPSGFLPKGQVSGGGGGGQARLTILVCACCLRSSHSEKAGVLSQNTTSLVAHCDECAYPVCPLFCSQQRSRCAGITPSSTIGSCQPC